MLFIHSAFRYVFWLLDFSLKSFGFFGIRLLVCFCHALPVIDRIFFRCFGTSSFVCIVLPFVDISLISLLSPVLSGLFPHVVQFFFLMLPFPFCSYIFQYLSFVLSFLPVFVNFLSAFPVEFPILVLIIFFVLFEGIPIFSQTNFAPA